jgi:hypothetical protein
LTFDHGIIKGENNIVYFTHEDAHASNKI